MEEVVVLITKKKGTIKQGQLLAESALSLHSQGPVLHNSVLY